MMQYPAPRLNPEIALGDNGIHDNMLIHMKRTTLLIETALYAELKRRAAAEQRTLTEVVERALRAGLRGPRRREVRHAIPSYDLGPYLEAPARREGSVESEPRRGAR